MIRTIQLGQLSSGANDHVTKEQTKKLIKFPIRNLVEGLKCFALRSGLHGIKYTQDKRLYNIERIVWALLCIVGLCFCSNIIIQLYGQYQTENTAIYIAKVNHGIDEVPFPSITFCPGTFIDWKKAVQAVNNLIRSKIIHENSTSALLDILKEISKLRFSHLSDLKIDTDNSTLSSFKDVDLSYLLYNVIPSCEHFFFNCWWSYQEENCCNLFEIQKTIYGFCYAFNSLTSINRKYKSNKDLINTTTYGIHGGLEFSVKYDNINYPPDSRENDTAIFMISSPEMYPVKTRKVRLGRKYNVNVKFMCTTASSAVIQLENSKNMLMCKYENNTYSSKMCLDSCAQKRIISKCACNPTFLYPADANCRRCNIEDLPCLTKKIDQYVDSCDCVKDCKYCYYYDESTALDLDENVISIDVHYDGPTGILYRTELYASDLDLLVQFGGIFGLFLGGSLITVIEFTYYCLFGTIGSIYQIFIKLKNKKKDQIRPNGLIVVNVMQYPENGNRHCINFSIELKN